MWEQVIASLRQSVSSIANALADYVLTEVAVETVFKTKDCKKDH